METSVRGSRTNDVMESFWMNMHEWMDDHVRSNEPWIGGENPNFPSFQMVWETLEVVRLLLITNDPERALRASTQFRDLRELIAEVCGWPRAHQEPWDAFRDGTLDVLFRYEPPINASYTERA